MVCHEANRIKGVKGNVSYNCARDEGAPFEAGWQERASNHLKVLCSKDTVLSV
jgi:hypothetical protein